MLLPGDLSYADGFDPRWDSYSRMMEPLAATVPIMHANPSNLRIAVSPNRCIVWEWRCRYAGGNHEFSSGAENWQGYNASRCRTLCDASPLH